MAGPPERTVGEVRHQGELVGGDAEGLLDAVELMRRVDQDSRHCAMALQSCEERPLVARRESMAEDQVGRLDSPGHHGEGQGHPDLFAV